MYHSSLHCCRRRVRRRRGEKPDIKFAVVSFQSGQYDIYAIFEEVPKNDEIDAVYIPPPVDTFTDEEDEMTILRWKNK
jgi:hypothetical protein